MTADYIIIPLGYVIALFSIVIALLLARVKSGKKKCIVYGIALMLPISPAIAISTGWTIAIVVENLWLAIMMFEFFPIVFILVVFFTGLIIFLIGIFKEGSKPQLNNRAI